MGGAHTTHKSSSPARESSLSPLLSRRGHRNKMPSFLLLPCCGCFLLNSSEEKLSYVFLESRVTNWGRMSVIKIMLTGKCGRRLMESRENQDCLK